MVDDTGVDILSIEDMTVTQAFCSYWFGRRTRRKLMVLRRIGLIRVERDPLGAMAGNYEVDDAKDEARSERNEVIWFKTTVAD